MKSLIFLLLESVIFISGCASVDQTIYLQDIKVSGPVNHPPLHITQGKKPGSFTVSPEISVNSISSFSGMLDGHTRVNDRGVYQVDKVENNDGTWEYKESNTNSFDFKGKNITWNIPDASFKFDLDWTVSNHTALFGGFNYAAQKQQDLFGGSAGIGFFSEEGNHGVRLDIGINWQSLAYDASTVVVTTVTPYSGSPSTDIKFFHDRDKSSAIDFFGSFTYNTAFENFPVNFFINAAYFKQTMFDFGPTEPDNAYYPFFLDIKTTDTRGKSSAAFFSFSPGIYQNFSSWGKVIFGVRMLKETQLDNPTGSFFILPVVRFDLSL